MSNIHQSKFVIRGGKKLEGSIRITGAKNAATKMMIASLLTDEPCELENAPDIGDVRITAELCRSIGCSVEIGSNLIRLHTPRILSSQVGSLSRRNRIPILAFGPLLARVGEAEVPILGGDLIGPRPVDIHIDALTAMGAEIKVLPDRYVGRAKNGLRGASIRLRYPSVGATENAVLAAVLAKGKTILKNTAVEPEVIDLIKMLQKMGALIELGTDRTVYIEGVPKLRGVRHRVLPDRNEAVSFACLAVATNGRIFVEDARQDDLLTFLNALRRIGGEYEVTNSGIWFYRAVPAVESGEGRSAFLRSLTLETDIHPGFMTDWQQPFAVLLTQAGGKSVIHETIYEDRFGYAQDLNSMGAKIKVFSRCLGELSCRFGDQKFSHSAEIEGPVSLQAANLKVRDLRSGIAHLIAALIADGESVIEGVEELDRGYDKIDERLRKLGADIVRKNT